jgi:hypothetical protein
VARDGIEPPTRGFSIPAGLAIGSGNAAISEGGELNLYGEKPLDALLAAVFGAHSPTPENIAKVREAIGRWVTVG